MENLIFQTFSEINLNDPFFDSLKADYSEFSIWFNKKSENRALVLYNSSGTIEGFLYCKFESGPGDDTTPLLPNTNHMKVGTFKFNPMQTRRGDRYLKKIFDYALSSDSAVEDIYVTVFGQKHQYLANLFQRYGFEHYATKTTPNGVEDVLLRSLSKRNNDVDKDYPFVPTKGNNKFLLGIRADFHTKLFPDSRLFTESPNIVRDISHSNSIHKIYICSMDGVLQFRRGDSIIIYRMGDGQGAAEYRAVATSLCVVENVHHISTYKNENDFVNSCIKFSVFSDYELRKIYRDGRYQYIINFTYNVALPKRPIRKSLIEDAGLNRNGYWGVMPLSDQQFNDVIRLSELDPKFLI
ncbi:acetyltransferase [Vibrio splendidus 5S-101]|uniref:hypothetical protein n=1 Tax=Vibrio splendidus TaxID=29497 RepID=UPI0002E6536A|nr:hypothetical protein [Vibrio splendidus]OEF21055.1 acetyltransferase [Vibrio splendidus 5S-101]